MKVENTQGGRSLGEESHERAAMKRSPATVGKRAELLDKTKWGMSFEWSQLEALAAYFEHYEIAGNTVLFREGSRDAYMGVITSGRVKIHKTGDSGKHRRICVLGSGQAFGEMSLIDGYPRSASVVAVEPVTLLIMTRAGFERLCNECPHLGVKLLEKIAKLMSERLRQTSGILIDYLDDVER